MYVRLAFAVAAHLEPEILVVDEVLAVGDAAFQKKCLGKMGDVAKEGRTVLFVSHNMGVIRSLCETAIWLNGGQIVKKGSADEVIQSYIKNQTQLFDESSYVMERDPAEIRNKSFYFNRVEILNTKSEHANVFSYNDDLVLIVFLDGSPKESFSVEFHIYNELGQFVSCGSSGAYHGIYFSETTRKVRIKIGPLSLTSGKYCIAFSLVKGIDGAGVSRADTWQNSCVFTIAECKPFRTNWEIPSFREGVCVLQQSFSEIE
jgi:lipopolysaccharide transport system ATP-binding protein